MRYMMLCGAAMMAMAGAALANDAAMDSGNGGMHGWHQPAQSRQEDIDRTKKHLAKLEHMTDQQWQAREQAREQRHQAWKNMTPDQRAAAKQQWQNGHGNEGDSSMNTQEPSSQSAPANTTRQ